VIAYSVAQRTQEMGLRLAIGARRTDVFRLILRQGLGLALFGVVLGVAGALALTQTLQSLLYGVSPTDPLIFTTVAVVLAAVAVAACCLPAWRAMRVDPMAALRYE
jgi:putative ABC transport system permease protein